MLLLRFKTVMLMNRLGISLLFLLVLVKVQAGTISGTIRSAADLQPLPFSAVLVKGSTKGVSANSKGFYQLQLEPGEYTLIGQFIGYGSVEQKIKVGKDPLQIDFELTPRQYSLTDVSVRSGGEDPAYAIVRKAIEQREAHLHEIQEFTCNVYIKGQMQLRDYPGKFFGQKVDFEDGDTSKRKMIFLSETMARYSVKEPDQRKVEVLSTKVSGRSDGFGLGSPQIISFYDNIISVGSSLNPRGFISPIADNALNYYRYRFEGTYFEFGREVSRIKVTPKRTYEPLFTGYIHISENDWRIQSVDLKLLKAQQLQLLDTLAITQQYVPAGNYWVIKNQVIYPAGKLLGFDFFGNFLQVYDGFDLNPAFKPKYFGNTVLKYFDSSNKKTAAYWDSIRPLPLLTEEAMDYRKKDSLEQVRKDPRYLDSLDRIRNKISVSGLLFTGETISRQKKKLTIGFPSLLQSFNYNTVEGGVLHIVPTIRKEFGGRNTLSVAPDLRYGFANNHFNPSLAATLQFGNKYLQRISVAGGKKVLQFNNANPVSGRINTLYTLLAEYNYQKLYEAAFFQASYSSGIGSGFNINAGVEFQDRYPLENLPDMVSWKDHANRQFTPNFPAELTPVNMLRHQAASLTVGLSWRPGSRYIEMPDRKINIGSGWPLFTASITQGIHGLLGSDVDYTRWSAAVSDELKLNLLGKLNYRFSMGGFLNAKQVFIPDYQHFQGNQTLLASAALNSFQLAPYYRYSNSAGFSAAGHVEYHLNGLISNKIPGFRKLNWFFVTGANALHISNGNNYLECFFGLENILKVFRVDFVQGFEKGGARPTGFRIAAPLFR